MFKSFAPDDRGTANDLSATFAYNPASQITGNVRTGDAEVYPEQRRRRRRRAWTQHFNQNVTGTPNGLNQLTAVGPKTLTHDTKGNVTAFGTKSFTYSSENLLLTGPGSMTLSYDGLMRLRRVVAGATTNMVYDGLDRIAEVSSSIVQRRYVHGPGVDEPILWYEGSGTTDRRFLSADERGSIVSVTNSAGALLGINRYDEYGQPQGTNLGVFGYTGQAWLPSLGAWYYKARVYDPELGRFLQPDPIGYRSGPNLYAYVLGDPVNLADFGGAQPESVMDRRLQPLANPNCGGSCMGFAKGFVSTPVDIFRTVQHLFGMATGDPRAAAVNNLALVARQTYGNNPAAVNAFATFLARENAAYIAGKATSNLVLNVVISRGAGLATKVAVASTFGTFSLSGAAVHQIDRVLGSIDARGFDSTAFADDAVLRMLLAATAGLSLKFDPNTGTLYGYLPGSVNRDRVVVCQFSGGACKPPPPKKDEEDGN